MLGIPKKSVHPSFSWRPFIVLGVILVVALGMRVYQWVRGPVAPVTEVPSVGWEEIAREEDVDEIQEKDVPEVSEDAVPDAQVDPLPSSADALPHAINLAVPFISQAPLGIWDAFTEETCEEASFLMVRSYYDGVPEGSIDSTAADTAFRSMVAVEESMDFGVSISTAQFLLFAEAYNGTVARVLENPSAEDLRALLAAGHPVIVPAFGRSLGNPFFTGEGPLYHMLVLRGYTPTTFIANDPGTRHGENYQYATDTLMHAIGDWDGDSPDGGSRVIVLDP